MKVMRVRFHPSKFGSNRPIRLEAVFWPANTFMFAFPFTQTLKVYETLFATGIPEDRKVIVPLASSLYASLPPSGSEIPAVTVVFPFSSLHAFDVKSKKLSLGK
ncbi:Hypothetical protein SRM_00267 [Salinibacter ruber M8]|uniref:Uncharacterized protein n=1 Tax=Salinibacter ruber (strain M8) TaxID=761659 RepID=D5H583_SALRM|nr:Hypothetical protein SRM_00267 [Salinibacter ruber M8]